MRAVYGQYSFQVNGVEFTTRTQVSETAGGRPYKYKTILNGKGQLLAIGSQPLSALQLQLETAFGQVGGNFLLYDDNNALTSIRLLSTGAEYPGVVVTDFSFPESRGGELVTGRTFQFSAEATYPSSGAAGAILDYTESVSQVGNGGSQVSWQNAFNGPPVPVRTFPFSIVQVVQQGSATGYLAYPTPPLPVLPVAYQQNQLQSVERKTPKPNGTEYTINWKYIFQYPGPLPRPLFPTVYIG